MSANLKILRASLGLVSIVFLVSACDETPGTEMYKGDLLAETPSPTTKSPTSVEPLNLKPSDLFLEEGLVSDITEEACTLSGGTETTCYRITVASLPTDHLPQITKQDRGALKRLPILLGQAAFGLRTER